LFEESFLNKTKEVLGMIDNDVIRHRPGVYASSSYFFPFFFFLFFSFAFMSAAFEARCHYIAITLAHCD